MSENLSEALPRRIRGASVRDLLAKNDRLKATNQRLQTERNVARDRAEAAERDARNMRRELDGIRERMREARALG